jgi:hypothetical protein
MAMQILQVCPGYYPVMGRVEQHVRNCGGPFIMLPLTTPGMTSHGNMKTSEIGWPQRNELRTRRFLSTNSIILHKIKEMGELRR